MKPNIDAKCRKVRALSGLMSLIMATFPFVFTYPETKTAKWLLSSFFIAMGLFQLWEAKRGWCIARACGIKTRI